MGIRVYVLKFTHKTKLEPVKMLLKYLPLLIKGNRSQIEQLSIIPAQLDFPEALKQMMGCRTDEVLCLHFKGPVELP